MYLFRVKNFSGLFCGQNNVSVIRKHDDMIRIHGIKCIHECFCGRVIGLSAVNHRKYAFIFEIFNHAFAGCCRNDGIFHMFFPVYFTL